jgi:hypothetical protein
MEGPHRETNEVRGGAADQQQDFAQHIRAYQGSSDLLGASASSSPVGRHDCGPGRAIETPVNRGRIVSGDPPQEGS